ncbi:DUF2199 domain-containing protein [Amycolatopsis sp. WGS_07]|uniref:DUF2199 domain-containing protein n=1 Tax=Amycolatopsis sp. WGS_07 TaxID=3076764 RepID=UPI0038733209
MTTDLGFDCSCCGRRHDELPLAYGAPAPAYWHDGLAGQPGFVLGEEQCVLGGEHFFVRGRLVLPMPDGEDFEWGVWVSLSEANFTRVTELWDDPARVDEPPYFGWLSTELPGYEPTTINLKTNLHSQPVGVRPLVELEPTDHPLALEQRNGIDRARVQEIAELLLHPGR